MKDVDRMEILKIAREIVNNEYADKRAQDHNKWLADSEALWKSHKIRLPYPKFPQFPTEDVIIARAKTLLDFIYGTDSTTKQESQAPVEAKAAQEVEQQKDVEQSVQEPLDDKPKEVSAPQEDTISNVPVPDALPQVNDTNIDVVEYANARISRDIEDYSSSSGRILPSVLNTIKNMRDSFTTR